MYGLLTKREVKMAGYMAKYFFGVFMDQNEVEVHKHGKKERGQYPAILTEQAWSIKDLLYGKKNTKSWLEHLRNKARIPSGQDGRSDSQSQREIRFILPAHASRHKINIGIRRLIPAVIWPAFSDDSVAGVTHLGRAKSSWPVFQH